MLWYLTSTFIVSLAYPLSVTRIITLVMIIILYSLIMINSSPIRILHRSTVMIIIFYRLVMNNHVKHQNTKEQSNPSPISNHIQQQPQLFPLNLLPLHSWCIISVDFTYSSELKFMAYDFYHLPPSLKPCDHMDTTYTQYLN